MAAQEVTLLELGVSGDVRYRGLQAAPPKRMLKPRMTVVASTATALKAIF